MDKQHIIYKITNQLNNRFYVGMHTGYPDDGYLGSGKRIKAEIKKYGRENFKKEILEVVSDRKSLKLREAEIVNAELLANPLCLNLKNGGEGGWARDASIRGNQSPKRNHTAIQEKVNQTFAQCNRERFNGNIGFRGFLPNWNGRKHRKEAKAKISSSMAGKQDGEKNSQFGTCWVTNGKPIKIKKELLDSYLQDGYVRGRKYVQVVE